MQTSDSLLEVTGLQVYYGETRAIDGVSLRVDKSELVALIGPNGAGKTTTLRTISGMLKPRSGSVKFQSEDITKLRPHQIASSGLSLVPEGRGLFTRMTVEENIYLGAFPRRVRSHLKENLKMVYDYFPVLQERRSQKAGSLSGGEQQMLAIARALMSSPAMVMLDEPSLGLAPVAVANVLKLLSKLRETGLTVLLVEQNVEAALSVASRAYLVEDGKTILEGKPEEFRNNKTIQESYLGA